MQFQVLELEQQNAALNMQEERISKSFQDGKTNSLQGGDLVHGFHFPKISVRHMEKKDLGNKEDVHKGIGVALSSSMFSVFLSLLVGIVTWQSQGSCIPLVLALFMVVGMSLKTVVQLFLSIGSRPGFDAVTLLSFNCFILGTLVYPALPKIVQTVAPSATTFGQWMYSWIGVHHMEERLKMIFL